MERKVIELDQKGITTEIQPTEDGSEETPIDIIRAVVSNPTPDTHIKAEIDKLRKYLKADLTCRDKIERDEGLAAWLEHRRDVFQLFDQPNITEARKQEIQSKLKEIDEKVLWYCEVREAEKGFSNELSKQLKEIQSCTPAEVRAAIQSEIGEVESYIAELGGKAGGEVLDPSYGNLIDQLREKRNVLVKEDQLLSWRSSVSGTVEEKEEAPGVDKEVVKKRVTRYNFQEAFPSQFSEMAADSLQKDAKKFGCFEGNIKETPTTTSTKKKQKHAVVVIQSTGAGTSSAAASGSMTSMEIVPRVTKGYPTAASIPTTAALTDEESAERSIAMFFFENKLDFSFARSPSYHQMIEAIGKCGPGFTGSSAEELKTAWLGRIKSEVSLQSKDAEKEWATTGCTIVADTWTDNKSRALINFLVSSPSITFFHRSVDASSYFKNTKYLADLFDSVIQDLGPENVVQIILDSSLNCTGIANHLQQSYATIFVSPCASQCLNLILEEFSRVDWVRGCILQAQTISKFIYNDALMLELMKKFIEGQELIRTGTTKSVSTFLSLQSMLKQKPRLKLMFNSLDYAAAASSLSCGNKPQTVAAILEDGVFWGAMEEIVAISEPFLKVMREVSGGRAAVGGIYEMMTRAKESIRTYYIMDECKCQTFLDIVERKWRDQLHSPLHSAAAFLNPSVQYNPEIKFLVSIKEDFFKVIEKLLPTPEVRRDITNQIFLFTRASGMFGCSLAMEAKDTVAPGVWWEQFGDAAPVLQRVAIRILSQVCSSFTFEKNWNSFQQIHSERRNKIDKESLNDLVYINYNLRLSRHLRSTKAAEVDPIQSDDIDMTSEWVEESDSTSPTQ